MYLKSLELLGFKSFASKTTLEFHRGVTAVVGPNGCGKSNVLDAIRWVLGEQSAKALRGGEMADVIFSGTDSRQALGMAEVSMTFAECEKELGVDWNEVRITRRVFRDGKSEYLINKTPCRLRDIHELFMDTGIGRSAYSIMEQGKIDQILSSKPEDRRAIFEEAAGITKYKAQKREALRKLEHTEANLVRVADIIREVKRQIGSLQRQAGKARRYQSISEALRIFDTHLSHRNFRVLNEELEEIQKEVGRIEETRALHEGEIESQEQEHAACRSRLGDLDEQVGNLRDECQQIRNRVFSAENRVESHGHRMEEFREIISRNESDIASAQEKLQEQEFRILETDARIEELLSMLRAGEESLRGGESKVRALRESREQGERALQEIAEQFSRNEAQILHLTTEKSSTQARREAAESRMAAVRAESSGSEEQLLSLISAIETAKSRISGLESSLAETTALLLQRQEESSALQAESGAAADRLRLAEQKSAESRSRLEVLEQLEARGEGLGEGTQALLRGLDDPSLLTPAISGALASLIDVDPRFVAALEAALGSDLQAVLFRDQEVASAALQTLSSGAYGRAHLLPTQWVRSMATTEPFFQALPEGAICWAIDCVRHPDELASFLRTRLHRVAFVESLADATRLREAHSGVTFVTLHGEIVGASGLSSAGKMGGGTAEAVLRKREIAEIAERCQRNQAEALSAQHEMDALQNRMAALQAEISEARQTQQNLQVELSSAKGEVQLLERQSQDANRRHEALCREIETLDSALEESQSRLGGYEERLQTFHNEQIRLRSEKESATVALSSFKEQEAAGLEELNLLRVRVATERQQRESLERQREPMAARLQELSELVAQRKSDIESYGIRIGSLEAEVVELSEGIRGWREELAGLESEVSSLLAQRSEVQESAEALETTLRVARHQLNDLQEKKGKLEIRGTQIQLRQENIREHILRRYQLELETFEPDGYALHKALKEHKLPVDSASGGSESEPPASALQALQAEWSSDSVDKPQENFSQESATDGIPWQEIQSVVAELTSRLDSMGPVNLDAIQEYEELEQRYNFLEQQNTDLNNSKQELMEVISKINKTTREMFAETFEKIRDNFQEMFRELFGGGRANLILSDESDPLESGIEIIAKPPGKQLQSVSLLSGGERTMTAVSLLFAIYMVKPSPFCVLDEMDAPLDESNISRFIKILDRFIGQSQFVVITHNKRTISRADMLYGVTMEEHGISKLVGVRFRSDSPAPTPDSEPAKEQSIAGAFGKSEELGISGDGKIPEQAPEPSLPVEVA